MALIHSPTIDEGGHLPAGVSHWYFGRFDVYSVNPHLVRTVAAIPVVLSSPETDWGNLVRDNRPEWLLGQKMAELNGDRIFWYFTIARWACIPFSLLGGWICYLWARDLYGYRSGLLALTLWVFSPNILGNAAQITPDAGAAAIGITAHYVFWKWLRGKNVGSMLVAGVALGVLLLTKSTWIILFGLWPLMAFIFEWVAYDRDERDYRRVIRQLSAILLTGLYLLNAGYGFTGTFTALGKYEFTSDALSNPTDKQWGRDNRFQGTILGKIPVPFPRDFVQGIDVQKTEFERGKWCYLNGHHKFRGWWYFYIAAFAYKTPVGTLLLALSGVVLTLGKHLSRSERGDMLALWLPGLTLFCFVSAQTGFTIYLRYILPVYPFVFIVCSACVRDEHPSNVMCNQWIHRAAWFLAATAIASSLYVYPHSLSYFNEAVGGPRQGHYFLNDANIDWGQDLLLLKEWIDEADMEEPLYVDLVSPLFVEHFGIRFTEITEIDQPGWYAISTHRLHHRDGRYEQFLSREPDACIGYSIYLFHVNRAREVGDPPKTPGIPTHY